jgi:hemerythrin superfamily protein
LVAHASSRREGAAVTDIRDEVTSLLSSQHQTIKNLMSAVSDSHGLNRVVGFEKFKTYLAAHEAVEEQYIHAIGKADLSNTDVVDRRIAEEDEAAAAITELESLDTENDDFATKFDVLINDVVEHAEAEEHRELPQILDAADEDELGRILAALKLVPVIAEHTRGAHAFLELLSTVTEELQARDDRLAAETDTE